LTAAYLFNVCRGSSLRNDPATACVSKRDMRVSTSGIGTGRVELLPNENIFPTNQYVVFLAGKRLPPDYYSADYLPLVFQAIHHQWINTMFDKADLVILTTQLIELMNEENAEELSNLAKPVLFPQSFDRDADFLNEKSFIQIER
jgi:hypothetical protein